MENTFSYRRQEILKGEPLIGDVKSRRPALFTAIEIDREFHRITALSLLSTFRAALDQYTPRLMGRFRCKGGAAGRKIKKVMVEISKDNSYETCMCPQVLVHLLERRPQETCEGLYGELRLAKNL
ncbi:hypothetical protein R3I93_011440 [Phoxinus phoxinus]|uniref:Uncharacterized protein n=1 Tax=Phoxinus phoxinus TaxID=58324 RepID=A0AAN9CVI2_9TELE